VAYGIPVMTAILYPVAANGEQAMTQPMGRAEREREAAGVAGEAVVFSTDPVGPAFATREAALDAYRAALSEHWCRLSEQVLSPIGKPAPPVFEAGRRWPVPPATAPRTAWRLMVSYWRIATAERPIAAPQARQARRARQPVDGETLAAIARQPMRPVEPQQPLDIGLFEVRRPEAPHSLMPDE